MKKNSLVLIMSAMTFSVCVGIMTANAAPIAKGHDDYDVIVIDEAAASLADIIHPAIALRACPVLEMPIIDLTAEPWKNSFFYAPLYAAESTCFADANPLPGEQPERWRSCGDLSMCNSNYFSESSIRGPTRFISTSDGSPEKTKVRITNPAARARRLC